MLNLTLKVDKLVLTTKHINVPSWNATYGHWGQKANANAGWRYEGKVKCLEGLGMTEDDWFYFQCDPVIKHRALVIVNVYLPHIGIQDIHNTNIKPILDGFSDAGLWADDEWAWVPIVMYKYAGITPGSRGIIIEVYELNSFTTGSIEIELPAGRQRNG